ncbi:FYVE and coiled-coil domain-containing protein 1 [Chanos chanos]|uniref:FYVE and coiled-coil domain-containing protein 1 n=1 Tax=Chanos chanos TaxID=29144 RepID=A0A6J2VFR5_CHACN|nr:FYVE and coiled-coil domain-containing protein 1-like [Chanos chanos]
MATTTVGENQLQRIIRDLHDAVSELSKEHTENQEPITDDSTSLHKFSYKLEYLLQFDQKEKTTFLGTRKDYWDFFCDCLAKIKGANDGIRFVKSIPELKTSLGKGRAFIRYCLVHQRLADTLQQCLMNQRATSDWYYARSPFLKSHLNVEIVNHLYELNEVQFDLASRGYDLDTDWPAFARRTLGSSVSPAQQWRALSRCSSVNSLASSYSQQPPEFLPGPDLGSSLLGDRGELGELSNFNAADDLRIELDQSELRQQDLQKRVNLLTEEAAHLKRVVKDLEEQLLVSKRANQELLKEKSKDNQFSDTKKKLIGERANGQCAVRLQATTQELEALRLKEASERHLENRLSVAENKNMELLAKLDEALSEKGQQVATYCDTAWKIQDLLAKLKKAEEEKLEAQRESEERARQAEKLAQDLRTQEESLKENEAKLATFRVSTEEDRAAALQQVEELQSAVNRLQGALSLKERETENLCTQLQDIQNSVEMREHQLEELKIRVQEEREEHQQKSSNLKNALEGQLHSLQEKLNDRETELSLSTQKVKQLEHQNQRLAGESQSLMEQAKRLEDYKAQCTSLMEINAKLLQTVKRNEESSRELIQTQTAMEKELATLRASERHLKSRLDSAELSVEEREKKLLEENQRLEESLQTALLKNETMEAGVRKLEVENQDPRDKQVAEMDQQAASHEELEGSPASKENLQESQMNTNSQLEGQVLETVGKNLGWRKEFNKTQGAEVGETTSRLALAEAQLDLNMKEVSRLQEEVTGLRAQLLVSAEERMKIQALLEVTEASREDLRAQTDQLKCQVEDLNRRHVEELLRCQEREESLGKERDREAQARADLQGEMVSMREELCALKRQNEALALENSEAREALHRANTETAELGVHVCMLTGQNEEAKLRFEGLSARLQELEESAQKDAQNLNDSVEILRKENASLQEKLKQAEGLPTALQELQQQLDQAQEKSTGMQESSQKEMDALRAKLNNETTEYEGKIKGLDEEIISLKSQLEAELQKISSLETKLTELEEANNNYSQMIEEKNALVASSESLLHQKEEQLKQVKGDLAKAEEDLGIAQKACQDLSESLGRVTAEKQVCDMKMSAEIDDLYRTKRNLEERLVELIRDKDALWQKSDALEFEQKLRAEEQTDKELNYCLGCQSQFSWWLRRHNCRLCGRPFCYYCCSHTVSTQQGGIRERCCKDCYSQHSTGVERHLQEEQGSSSNSPYSPLSTPTRASMPSVTVALQSSRPDDAAFDIITEEEVNCVYDSDSLSYTTALSPDRAQQGGNELNSSSNAGDTTTEDSEEQIGSVQDAEICLLKSGEITQSIPLTVQDIAQFGAKSKELFIKSSCYSMIPVTVGNAGPSISWVFSSEPKSISFSVVYRENSDTPLEQAKVLIPLTRCNSHKQTIEGQLKVRNPGEYTLIFDNSFSRFISKKVQYRLSVDQPGI